MSLVGRCTGTLHSRFADLPGNLQGACWIALAGFVLTLMTACIKSVGETIPVVEILFVRQMVMTAAMLPGMIRDPRGRFRTKTLHLHACRICLSTFSMMAGFTAMVHLPLADATAISFSRGFFVAIFAILILHEVVDRHRWIGLGVGFIGVLIIADPRGGDVNPYALLALGAAGAVAMIMVIVRKLSQSEKLTTVITYQAIGVGLLLVVPAWMVWVPPTPAQWAMLVLTGILSTLGQSLNFMGFRVGEATALAPVDYLRLIYSVVIGAVFFLEAPTWTVLAGAFLVMGGTAWGLWHEHHSTQTA